jgi:F-type H+-transporting ATPase subunit alpha
VNTGIFDDIDVRKALAAEKSMRDFVKGKYGDVVKRIEDTKDLSKDDEEKLQSAMKEWKSTATY